MRLRVFRASSALRISASLVPEAITVQVDLRALLQGNLVLPRVRLESPVLILEKAAQGPANWQFGKGGKAKSSANEQQFWLP